MKKPPALNHRTTTEQQYVVDAISPQDTWRIFRVMAEFVEGFDTLNNLPPCITIFGSARSRPDGPVYQRAEKLAGELVGRGYAVMTGGGPGVMEAANKGAYEADGLSIGLNIDLPLEQKPNPYINRAVDFRYFFVRKVMLLKYSQAFIIFPGGFGTMDEFFESITLIQTNKMKAFPVILFDRSYWDGLLDWIEGHLLGRSLIAPEDMDIFSCVDEIDEVWPILERWKSRHSEA